MKKKIVTIGGGSGSPVVNEALLRTGKVDFINAIVTPFDNGGATGLHRLDSFGKKIAYSDAIRILFSLISPDNHSDKNVEVVKRWLLFRDERNRVAGRDIFHNFFSIKTGFSQIEADFSDLGIKVHGQVLPSSTESSQIVFTTQTGDVFKGEDQLDQHSTSLDMVSNMTLEPGVPGYLPAIKVIKDADFIFLSCGSFYGSLLCNFLPDGIKEAMRGSKAKVYLVTNLFSTRNETNEATPHTLIDIVEKYSGKRINGLIIPNLSEKQFKDQYKEANDLYKIRESSHFLGWDKKIIDKMQKEGFEIIKHNALKVIPIPDEKKIIVRHDPVRLADALKTLL